MSPSDLTLGLMTVLGLALLLALLRLIYLVVADWADRQEHRLWEAEKERARAEVHARYHLREES